MIAWTIYVTFGGAVLLLLLPGAFARWIGLLTTIAGLALGMIVFVGTPISDLAQFTTIVRVPWIPTLGTNYHLALDGVSLTMVLVTGISAVSTVLFSWDVEHRQNEFFLASAGGGRVLRRVPERGPVFAVRLLRVGDRTEIFSHRDLRLD